MSKQIILKRFWNFLNRRPFEILRKKVHYFDYVCFITVLTNPNLTLPEFIFWFQKHLICLSNIFDKSIFDKLTDFVELLYLLVVLIFYFFQQTFEAWRTVFLVTSGIYVFDTLAFILLGKSEVQPWNNISKNI